MIFAFCIFSKVWAAELKLNSQTQEIGINQQFQVDLILDTENESINAVEGKIVFSPELLELKEIRDGNSIINFWVERPLRVVSCSYSCEFVFSGITPGGYLGNQGLIFSAIFQAKKEGKRIIEINDAKVLLNDGKGTAAKLVNKNLEFRIQDLGTGSQIKDVGRPYIDVELPEEFKPEIAQSSDMFEGKWFLVFATQDKGSGIDHYEVYEDLGFKIQDLGKVIKKILYPKSYIINYWIIAESPYVLKDQKLRSWIYVKALDKAGNERIAVVEPKYPLKWYEQPLIWIIIVIVGIIVYLIWRKLKNK